MSTEELLLIFVKNRQKGRVKTRLATSVGERKALAIYEQLLQYTRDTVKPLGVDTQVWYSRYIPLNDLWDEIGVAKRTQTGDNLGERMKNAFSSAFEEGYRRVVIIGSDCAELTTEILEQAFSKLQDHDAVIGPSNDGGYYLLGMNRPYPELFDQKQWSTPSVFRETVEQMQQMNLGYSKLQKLSDVDTIDDWQQVKSRFLDSTE